MGNDITLMTWRTYRQKNNPILFQTFDNTLGVNSIIDPTMRNSGFYKTSIDIPIDSDKKPKQYVVDNLPSGAVMVVYHVFTWRSPVAKTIDIYYKTESV